MRPLLFWTFYALAKLKFAVDFGFPLIAVGSDHLARGIKSSFPKTISDQCADFQPLCMLCLRHGSSEPDWERFLWSFQRSGRNPLSSSSFFVPGALQGRLRGLPERRAPGSRDTMSPHTHAVPPTHACASALWGHGSGSINATTVTDVGLAHVEF